MTEGRDLLQEFTDRFIGHYYPALERHGIQREKRDNVIIKMNLEAIFKKRDTGRLKRALIRNYEKHLGLEAGLKEATDFFESVRDLVAEIILSE